MKIAIVSIFIGNYSVFWEDYFFSAMQNLLPNESKEFFVFTDSKRILKSTNSQIHAIEVQNQGWPSNSTRRFEFILSISNQIKEFDYTLFYQSNSLFITPLLFKEILFKNKLTVIKHPVSNEQHKIHRPYERRKKSSAYVRYGDEGDFYYAAGAFGGCTTYVLELSRFVLNLIIDDSNKSVMAKWFDESYYNKALLSFEHRLRILSFQYIFPENLESASKPIVLMRNKDKYFDSENAKMEKNNYLKYKRKVSNKLRRIYEKLLINLKF
jgi:hypothetical protein